MICERHGLAAGPDGHCALCGRAKRLSVDAHARPEDKALRRVAKIALAIVVGVATFAGLLALLDTR